MDKPNLFSNPVGSYTSLGGNSTAKFNLKDQYSSAQFQNQGDTFYGQNDSFIQNKRDLNNISMNNLSMQQHYNNQEIQHRPQSSRGNKIFQNTRQNQVKQVGQQGLNFKQDRNPASLASANQNQSGFLGGGQSQQRVNSIGYDNQATFNEQNQQQYQLINNYSTPLRSSNQNQTQNSFSTPQRNIIQIDDNKYDKLLKKAELVTDKFREFTSIFEAIAEKRRLLFSEYDSCLDRIDAQKRRLHECSRNSSKSFFLQNSGHEVLLFKDKKCELSKVQEECQKVVEQYEALERKFQSVQIKQQQQQPKEEFEFESEFLSLSDQCSTIITSIRATLENYKKLFKIDRSSNKFYEVQNQLESIISEFEGRENELFTNIGELISEFVKQIKVLRKEVEENSDFYSILLTSFEESFDIVKELIYYRQDKMIEIQDRITSKIQLVLHNHILSSEDSINNDNQFYQSQQHRRKKSSQAGFNLNNRKNLKEQIEKEILDIKEIISKVKKQAKSTHTSQKSMFFIELRAKLICKLINEINSKAISPLQEFEKVTQYCLGGELQSDQQYCQNLVSNGSQLIQVFKNTSVIQFDKQPFKQEDILTILNKSHQQLLQLMELKSKLEQLSLLSSFSVVLVPFEQMQFQLQKSILDLQKEQSLVLPPVMYKNEMAHFANHQQKIQNYILKSKQVSSIFMNNPEHFLKIDKNYHLLPQLLQLKAELLNSYQFLTQMLQFCQLNKNTPCTDQSTVNKDNNQIQSQLSSVLYYLTNLTIISNILEASLCLASQNLINLNFQIDNNLKCLTSDLPNKIIETEKSIKNLQNLEERSQYGSQAEKNILKTKKQLEAILSSANFIFSKWDAEGKDMLKKFQRFEVANENINSYLNEHFELLNERIEYEMQGCIELEKCLKQQAKQYKECVIRFVFNLESKELNPYSANHLISWLNANYSIVFDHPSYLFDLYDLIKYQSSMNNNLSNINHSSAESISEQSEFNIQIKLLRSRITESMLSESNLLKLLNQDSLVVEMKLELILKVVLQDSLLHDYSQFDQIVTIAKQLNDRIRQSQRLAKIINEQYQLDLTLFSSSKSEINELAQVFQKYYSLLSWEKSKCILLASGINQEVRVVIEKEINKNENAVESLLLGTVQDEQNYEKSQCDQKKLSEVLGLLKELHEFIGAFEQMSDLIDLSIFKNGKNISNQEHPLSIIQSSPQSDKSTIDNWLFKSSKGISIQQTLEQKLKALKCVIDSNLYDQLAEKLTEIEEEQNDSQKLRSPIGLFEHLSNFQYFQSIKNNKDLLQWSEFLEELLKNNGKMETKNLSNLQKIVHLELNEAQKK